MVRRSGNRSGRNVRNVRSRMAARNTGHRTRNTGMSRRRFIGGVAAGVAGAAMAGAGVVHATPGVIHVYPGDDIEDVIENVAQDSDTVIVHRSGGDGTGEYDIGEETIFVGKALTISGDDDGSGNKPLINGSSKVNVYDSGGVFFVDAPEKNVIIRNLDINHVVNPYVHTTVTVANNGSALFHLDNCDITTGATSACLHREITQATQGRHIKITGCTIEGKLGDYGTNYSCINLGSFWTGIDVNLKGGGLEVTGCTLDPGSFIGIAGFGFLSNSNTRVLLDNNKIGKNRDTACGISIGPYTLPKGTITITNNVIKSSTSYAGRASWGIATNCSAGPVNSLYTTISNNEIEMALDHTPRDHCDGIIYNDLSPHSANTSALISNNTITSTTEFYPMKGMAFGKGGWFLPPGGAAINANVTQNNLKGLTAAVNQAYVGHSINCEFKNNDYGPVDLNSSPAAFKLSGINCNLVNENFWGAYPGIYGSPPIPCLWLTEDSSGVTVTALKSGQALQGFDICTQILNNGENIINGYERCENVPQHVIENMRRKECLALGGTWFEDPPGSGEWYCEYPPEEPFEEL